MTTESPYEVLTAYQKSAAVMAAAQCGLFEALVPGPKSAEELAAPLGLDPYAVDVLLDALVTCGYLDQNENSQYTHNGFSRDFTKDSPYSLSNIVDKEWFFYTKWANLAENIKSGKAALAPFAERCESAPGEVKTFLTALNDIAGMSAPAVLEAAQLPDSGSLLDFGGGMGGYAKNIYREHPGLNITLVDHPHVCGLCHEHLEEIGLGDKLKIVAGDLFDLEPVLGNEQFDIVFVSHILHDYAPPEAEKILLSAAKLLKQDGRLYLLDVPKPAHDGSTAEALFNVMMLVEAPGGRTHEATSIENWLSSAGLQVCTTSKMLFGTLYEAKYNK